MVDLNKQKKSTEFKTRVYKLILCILNKIENLPKDQISKRVGDQLLRSSTSILANYVEGHASSSRKDFTNFMNHSLKSANETVLWLALLKDTGKLDSKSADKYIKEVKEIANIFGSSLITLRNKR
jgi:four helix bundle protein